MAEAADGGACGTETVTQSGGAQPENRSLTLKLRKRKPEKKVGWTTDTVDNEQLGRRSSKCCCIYEKPRAFGESSTESEEEEEEEEEEEGCGHAHCVRGHKRGRGRRGGRRRGGRDPKIYLEVLRDPRRPWSTEGPKSRITTAPKSGTDPKWDPRWSG